jgi:hypothetical protein
MQNDNRTEHKMGKKFFFMQAVLKRSSYASQGTIISSVAWVKSKEFNIAAVQSSFITPAHCSFGYHKYKKKPDQSKDCDAHEAKNSFKK